MNNIVLKSKTVKYIPAWKKIKLSPKDYDNFIQLDGIDYQLKYLYNIPGNKGGNSIIFILENLSGDFEDLIIKLCNIPLERSSKKYQRRFIREIIALKKAKKAKKNRIIHFIHTGVLKLNDLSFPFFTMQKADADLSDMIIANNINDNQKLLICYEITKGIKELHELNIYHRDIKHNNFLFFGKEWKVIDLGLVRWREDDAEVIESEFGERLGAFGWETPEGMNKYLTENKEGTEYDCEVDMQSDIFQLGKLFWYIFQGNLPIGQVQEEDFKNGDLNIFTLITTMLQYSKSTRCKTIDEVKTLIDPIAKNYSII